MFNLWRTHEISDTVNRLRIGPLSASQRASLGTASDAVFFFALSTMMKAVVVAAVIMSTALAAIDFVCWQGGGVRRGFCSASFCCRSR